MGKLKERLAKFDLEVAEEKTRILPFDVRGGCWESFDFLGFTFYVAKARAGFLRTAVRSSAKKLKAKRQAVTIWLRRQFNQPVVETLKTLDRKLGPWATPDEKGAGPGSFFADYAFAEGIALDPKTGSRFMNELADRRTRAEAQLRVLAKGTKDEPNYPFCFCSEETTTRAEGFKAAYREGTVKKSNTVEDLARLHHVDLAALKAAIADWNGIVAGRKADPFKKPLDVKTELKAPFYSMRLSPKLHYCMGGAAITTKAEVVSASTCRPIPGLYAAGEVTGGVHGMDRLGG